MGRRSRGYRSAPPVYGFTPGIVEHGEVMRITRKTFIVPDESPLPQGRRTMTVGRKSYSWTTARDVSKPRDGSFTDHLPEDSPPDRRTVLMADDVVQPSSSVTPEDRAKWGLVYTAAPRTFSKVTVGDDLRALPGKPARPAKPARVPRQNSAPREKTDRDAPVREYLASKGLSAAVVEITPAIRAAALEALESERQLAEYSAA